VEVIHNHWASQALLDGQYPAIVYEHEFVISKESTGRVGYIGDYLSMTSYMTADPQTVELENNGNTAMWFGECYLDKPEQAEPEDMLLVEAGLIRLRFIGTVLPSMV
jgi:hypothetical protein